MLKGIHLFFIYCFYLSELLFLTSLSVLLCQPLLFYMAYIFLQPEWRVIEKESNSSFRPFNRKKEEFQHPLTAIYLGQQQQVGMIK